MLEKIMLKGNKLRIHIVIICIAIIFIGAILLFNYVQKTNRFELLSNVNITTTLDEEIKSDTYWCGGFNLAWQEFMKLHVNQEDGFINPSQNLSDLNSYYFQEDSVSDIYTLSGIKSLELKNKLESDIYEKYEEVCGILSSVKWRKPGKDSSNNYLIYSRLNKNIEFEKKFTEFGKDLFLGAKKTTYNVKYFGIDKNTLENVYSQVQVLYHNSDADYAVKLITKSLDEIIICTTEIDTTLWDIYQNILTSSEIYLGSKNFAKGDTLKVPYIDFSKKINYTALQNIAFIDKNNEKSTVTDVWQTIEFKIDNSVSKPQTDENKDMSYDAAMAMDLENSDENRNFSFTNPFAIFLKESTSDMPYFAAYIEDISKFE